MLPVFEGECRQEEGEIAVYMLQLLCLQQFRGRDIFYASWLRVEVKSKSN